MSVFKNLILCGILVISLGMVNRSPAQVPTYTIDPNFNTGELFRDGSPVYDFHVLEDGRYLVGGMFANHVVSPIESFGMLFSNGILDSNWGFPFETQVLKIIPQHDGYVYPSIQGMNKILLNGMAWSIANQEFWSDYFVGGTFNPYNVVRIWDIHQMENGDLLLGGAIANDTLLPNELRGISRIHADGSHDPTFPVLNITPNNASGAVREIFPAPDGNWYVSGSFTALNGHETNHVAKLNSNFEVDTTFVSPFMYDGPVNYTEDIILVDSQSRVWVSGYNMRLLENPNDTIQLCRLMPDGTLDITFPLTNLTSNYPDEWMTWRPEHAVQAMEIEAFPGNYILNGSFSHFNDTLQPCIAVVNYNGIIQHNFFQGQGATEHKPYSNTDDYIDPAVYMIEQLDNGDLLVGGAFSVFMGQTHHSVVKLKQGFVGVEERDQKPEIKVYPNPASDVLNISGSDANIKSGAIFSALGYKVDSFILKNGKTQIDVQKLNPGIYFVKVQLENGRTAVGKFVKVK